MSSVTSRFRHLRVWQGLLLSVLMVGAQAMAQDATSPTETYCWLECAGAPGSGQSLRLELTRAGRGVVTHGLVPATVDASGVVWSSSGLEGTLTIVSVRMDPPITAHLTITARLSGIRLSGAWSGDVGGRQVTGDLTGGLLRRQLWVLPLDSSQNGNAKDFRRIIVLDIDGGHREVRSITTPGLATCSPGSGASAGGARGLAAHPVTDRFYYSLDHKNYPGLFGAGYERRYPQGRFQGVLGCVDMRSGAVVFEVEVPGTGDPALDRAGQRLLRAACP